MDTCFAVLPCSLKGPGLSKRRGKGRCNDFPGEMTAGASGACGTATAINLRLLQRGDSLFQQKIPVFTRLTGHDHGECVAGAIVKIETPNPHWWFGILDMPPGDRHILALNLGIQRIPLHCLHHDQRVGIGIEFEQWEDGVK